MIQISYICYSKIHEFIVVSYWMSNKNKDDKRYIKCLQCVTGNNIEKDKLIITKTMLYCEI